MLVAVLVELVFTERRAELSDARARNFERLRQCLLEASGGPIEVAHYEAVDARRLADADAVVLSGSTAAVAERRRAGTARRSGLRV